MPDTGGMLNRFRLTRSGNGTGASVTPGVTRAAAAAGALGLVLTVGACSSGSSSSDKSVASPKTTHHVNVPITIAADVAADGRIGLAQPVTASAKGAKISKIAVTDSKGKPADGTFDAKTSSWHPAGVLDKNSQYTVTATADASDGGTSTSKRTLTSASDGTSTTGIYIVDPYKEQTVGNAQPVAVTFSQAVPAASRQAVQDRLKVTDTKHVEGAWRWLSPTRLDYRPKDFWPVGDKITLSGDIQSMKIGNTWGAGNISGTVTVDSDLQAVYDPSKKVVTVSKGGKVVRRMLADGGKPGLETVSGSMTVLGKSPMVRMRSCSVGLSCTPGVGDYYDELIRDAVQITPTGTYLHAAPWDSQLGEVDSSHGCIHLSVEDAAWFYDQAEPGDLVKVLGNANPVGITNGNGDWNLSWEQWTAKS